MSDTPPPLPQDSPPLPVPVIDYDTPPRADHVTRRRYVVVLVAAAVMGAILVGLLFIRVAQPRASSATIVTARGLVSSSSQSQAQQAQYQAKVRWGQQRLNDLLTNEPPAQTIAYEEDPASAATLKALGGVQEASRQSMSKPLWGAFQPPIFIPAPFAREHGGEPGGLLFAHERVSPSGNRRLVLMEIGVALEAVNHKGEEADIKLRRQLKYRICEPKLFTTAPNVLRYGQSLAIAQSSNGNVIPIRWVDGSLRAARPVEQNLRFYAGQVDRKDNSHFTIDYVLGKQSNSIDVYLTDDDFLRVIPRDGMIDGGTWRIDESSSKPAEAPN